MSCAIVLICDTNFILPSFATAVSARANISDQAARIFIFVTDATDEGLDKLRRAASSERIELVAAPIPEIEEFKARHRDRFLPVAALSRFWVDTMLPDDIDRFLYLDGDILVNRPIDDLLACEPPERGILTAPDTLCLCEGERGPGPKREKAYIDALGVAFPDYFNSGVLLADRAGWRSIAGDSLAFLRDHHDKCRSSDQSALNAVAGTRRGRLSLRWNYQSDHMTILDPRAEGLEPAIYHFTGAPKPWHLADWPWDESFNWAYRRAERIMAGLGVENPTPSPAQLQAGLAHRARARIRLTWYYPWRRLTRARKIRQALVEGAGGFAARPLAQAA
ncbi:MAG: glycosyltransferase [Hyphomicrobiales bacterium]|nr:glycosyltransferase [Hyphomicrobiales bacterium]